MYNTKQKSQLTDFLKENMSHQLTINEIMEGVCRNGISGKSTIYRQLSKMVDNGTLLRVYGDDSKSVLYQYAGAETRCDTHFHLKCTQCGKLIHLDCSHLEEIGIHIKKEHSFAIDMKKTVFYGVCGSCADKGEE